MPCSPSQAASGSPSGTATGARGLEHTPGRERHQGGIAGAERDQRPHVVGAAPPDAAVVAAGLYAGL